jgi:single-stranded-DNA-specific exonuclease
MERAVDVILKAVKKQEHILIFGDYDADGIAGSVVLFRFLREFTNKVDFFVPSRINHGYGLTMKALKEISIDKYSLVITVDCGMDAICEGNYLRSKGIDLVVTDHHEVSALLPPAVAIINPKLDDSYPFKDLAGCGVAFKIVEALAEALGVEKRDYLTPLLPYVALGTIADSMKLVGENRFLVKYGLKFIKKSKPLVFLISNLGLNVDNVSVEDIAFYVAPRINAPGRMESADVSFRFLMEDETVNLNRLLFEIESINSKRQREQQRIISRIGPIEEGFYYIYDENLHPGVVSVVASRISHTYRKPTFVISLIGDFGRGSARVSKNFKGLYDIFKKVGSCLLTWGGHDSAVGFTIKREMVETLRMRLLDELVYLEEVENRLVDGVIRFEDIDAKFVRDLVRLQPFGEGFDEPLFMFEKVEVRNVWKEGRKRRVLLLQDLIAVEGIVEGDLEVICGFYDIVGTPYIEDSDGRKKIVIKVKDAKRL